MHKSKIENILITEESEETDWFVKLPNTITIEARKMNTE
jgi:hypothetical protein